jgi:hypothetical protein
VHSPGQSSWHSGWNGSISTTASRSNGFEVDQVALQPADILVLRVGCGVALLVDEELLEVGHDLVADLLRHRAHSPTSAAEAVSGDEHSLHDRLEPELEIDRRPFRDAKHFDAEVCGRRRREGPPTLRPRAAAELAVSSTSGALGSRRTDSLPDEDTQTRSPVRSDRRCRDQGAKNRQTSLPNTRAQRPKRPGVPGQVSRSASCPRCSGQLDLVDLVRGPGSSNGEPARRAARGRA